ncbi:MAG: atypical/PIKK/ATR protein kinase [Amphiamblys sp. WSBS2006]|nr:MAG: atypical/PIKK/ATR protein kinase [Amphiamblys sp. WSBS2006]
MIEVEKYFVLFQEKCDLISLCTIAEDAISTLSSFAWKEMFLVLYSAVTAEFGQTEAAYSADLRERLQRILSVGGPCLFEFFPDETSFLCYRFKIHDEDLRRKTEMKQEEIFLGADRTAKEFFGNFIGTVLLPLYLKTHSTDEKNIVTHGIQSLLKHFGIDRKRILAEFSKDEAAVLELFLETGYNVKGRSWSRAKHPLFMNTSSKTEWRKECIRILTDSLGEEIRGAVEECSFLYLNVESVAVFFLKNFLIAAIATDRACYVFEEFLLLKEAYQREERHVEYIDELIGILDEIAMAAARRNGSLSEHSRQRVLVWCGAMLCPKIAIQRGFYETAIRWIDTFIQNGVWEDSGEIRMQLEWGIEGYHGLQCVGGMLGYEAVLWGRGELRMTSRVRGMLCEATGEWGEAEQWHEKAVSSEKCKENGEGLLRTLLEQGKCSGVLSRLSSDLSGLGEEFVEEFKSEAALRMGSWGVADFRRNFYYLDHEKHTEPSSVFFHFLAQKIVPKKRGGLLKGVSGRVVIGKMLDAVRERQAATLDYGTLQQRQFFYHAQVGLHTMRGCREGADSSCLSLARVLRESGRTEIAREFLSRIENRTGDVAIEMARTEWSCGRHVKAIQLVRGLNTKRAKYLAARWMGESRVFSARDVLGVFREAKDMAGENTEVLFHMGEYNRRAWEHMRGEGVHNTVPGQSVFNAALKAYGLLLTAPSKYASIGLTKMLNMWLSEEKTTDKTDEIVKQLAEKIPAENLVYGLSAMLPRMCHGGTAVKRLLRMVSRIFGTYPHQTAWALLLLHNSRHELKRKKACEVLGCQSQKTKAVFSEYSRLSKALVEFSNQARTHSKSLYTEMPPSQTLFPAVMLPLHSLLVPPPPLALYPQPVFIEKFLEEFSVLSSLQRPKRVSVLGSDGRVYSFLCKARDDLRRDSLFMEFGKNINEFLPAKMRVFGVCPLDEECGVIEWVQNTATFGSIVSGQSAAGRRSSDGAHKALLRKDKNVTEEFFVKEVLKKAPPVFHRWFLEQFPDAGGWYQARARYIQTTAVMSMVGHIVGLGDRHTENILYDTETAETVHVDFSCLFERGKKLPVPEVVPFRLTQNMVHAMGVAGYEGVFRKTCEKTLAVIQENRDTLMAILEALVSDPFVRWGEEEGNGVYKNTQAESHLRVIQKKISSVLDGVLPMSVEGHVGHVVSQAADNGNLCRMFAGWRPYI